MGRGSHANGGRATPPRISETWLQAGFEGTVGRTYRDSVPDWPEPVRAAGRPNVVFVVLDDVGFGSLGCYGSEIETPTMDALAAAGVLLTNFHATALCSPTRASLLTGRNHHAVGMAYLSHVDDGYPGYRGQISHQAATLAEILGDVGYHTLAIGKWHLTPMDQTTAAGPYDQWPLGRGFDRYYGFLEGLTDHYHPELFEDNHPVDPPYGPEEGYHLSADLVDRSIQLLGDQWSIAPEKPFFLYLAFGATHTPFQAPEPFVRKYAGVYDRGWDEIRAERHARQLELGIIPEGTALAPRNEGVVAWDTLSPEAQRLYARFQEVYAAFLDHTDHELGRLVEHLRATGQSEDTVVVLLSDNGASQEGGPHGVLNTTVYENGHFPTLEENLRRAGDVDGRTAHVNYPLGWAQAGNTPLKRYKQNTHAGGVRTACIMRLPHGRHAGEVRDHFQHVTDIVPTVLDLLDVPAPAAYRGVPQLPLDGVSMRATLDEPEAARGPRTQYFETLGHRAIWKDGWKAVTYHRRGDDYDDDEWELYHVEEDFSECHDLAQSHPEKLAELVTAWWVEAGRNQVLPLDDRGFAERAAITIRPHSPRDRSVFVYRNGMHHIGTGAAPVTPGRSFAIRAEIDRPDDSANGVLLAHGSVNSGYCLLIDDGRLVYDFNYYGEHARTVSETALGLGRSSVEMRFERDGGASTAGRVTLLVDGTVAGTGRLERTFENFVAFQGLDVGADRLSPVRQGGHGPFPFSGGLEHVVIEILDGPVTRGHHPCD